ncbi:MULTISPECIES: penicillin acylase family protein [Pseudomonas syringae group]|uniref:Acyl-homoserine lactone acylase QuiP n=2 Tax=Pseudomonas syringae group TaxID=136849 RepID=A0ABY1UAQ0_PSESX|nr:MULTISPECIES: penicillin acylase family protein [Pseudomonas syringae group]KWT00482.1 acyl-homoserine lactone acylase subunit beta [Pseudomonas syringae pv. avii]POQ07411.1 penicillin acylase family protein [Pseudomonas syringae pv. avii]SOQ12697.1 penicillin amidase [Pseudomonas syringae pv. persicae]SOQ12712.1 penicillin amidase [Pseudomonas syringae pv. persicae]SOS28528.1 Acyl-homoserine lactone acylase QuiP [Pseudomonas syringae pv. avii]
MASPALRHFLPRFGAAAAAASFLSLAGCQLGGGDPETVLPASGTFPLKGLAQNVSVRRNNMGMPLIESSTYHDALFTLGYVHAGDRIGQMLGMRLLAQGRLSEVAGADALEVDRLMRSVNLKRNASDLYNAASPRLKRFFDVYARGVNAYLFRYRDKLPADVARAGYTPEYWKPEDSALIFSLLNFSLSVNLQEELSALVLAQKVGADKLAWLLPTYPDEELPFAEADKLKGLNLSNQVTGLSDLNRIALQLSDLNMLGVAASSNWAIAPQRSRSGKSLLASDMQLPAGLNSAWSFVQIRAPKYQVSGASIAGLPLVLSGFNGKLAWSMSNVKGDNQDLFLEKIKREGNRVSYMADGKWVPAASHQETFLVKGGSPIRETVYETRHGALLNASATPPVNGLSLALQVPDFKDDKSLDAFFDLSRAPNVEKAFDTSREIRAITLNMVFADASNIGWQVTGRFPNRREGQGLLPSPGWDGKYDWDGFADSMLHPYDQDPRQGWLAAANQRTIPKGYGMQLSNSWGYPERAERIAELANSGKQDLRSTVAMQYDQTTTFAAKLKTMFQAPGMSKPLKQAIDALPEADRNNAREAFTRLMAFDGKLSATSADAALYELFLQESAKQIFLDELGPETSPAWQALVANASSSYSPQADHLLGRDDSPYWDDVKTPQKEDKPAILARSLAAAVTRGDSLLGSDHKAWQWGKLHRDNWTSANPLAKQLGGGEFNRSASAAGGDHTTLNVSGFEWGKGFDARVAPSLRMIVDFSLVEPMTGMINTGQSGNPASPYYANSIEPWQKGQYMSIPLQQQNYEKGYGKQRLTLTPGK